MRTLAASIPAPSKGGAFRSLSEVLGQDMVAAALAAKIQPVGPLPSVSADDLDALFGASSRGPSNGSEQASPSVSGQSPPSMQPAAEANPGSKLLHDKYGYAALGGIVPKETSGDGPDMLASQPRVHPRRTFTPGQRYEPSVRMQQVVHARLHDHSITSPLHPIAKSMRRVAGISPQP